MKRSIWSIIKLEWKCTYKTSRRNGWSRQWAFWFFLDQTLQGIHGRHRNDREDEE